MTTEVSSQSLYAALTQEGLGVSSQTLYAVLLSAQVEVSSHTLYAVLLDETTPPPAGRRRQALLGSF